MDIDEGKKVCQKPDSNQREVEATTGLKSILHPLTEAEHARYLERGGEKIVRHGDRFWRCQSSGFYYPTHELARLSREEAVRPASLCWGFRTSLREEDAAYSTGTLPIHILSDLPGYGIRSLEQKRRTSVRKFWKMVEVVELTSPDLLRDQAYEIVVSDYARHRYGKLPNREEYMETIGRFFEWNLVVLAGLVDGKLGGFIVGLRVGSTAYIEEIRVHSDMMHTNMASGLVFELVQVCKRSPGLQEVAYALHVRENESLSYFKEDMGFPVKQIPSLCWFVPFAEKIISRKRPHTYYRFYGSDYSERNHNVRPSLT
jgi:hypothetical protein